jgi:hypothetical protein
MTVQIPKSSRHAAFHAEKDVDNARLLQAVQTMDTNANARLKYLRLFLFFLPVISGIVWRRLYFVLLLAIAKS